MSVAISDGDLADKEINAIRSMCVWNPIFAKNSADRDTEIMRDSVDWVVDEGIDKALEAVVGVLSPALRETSFIFAARVAFAEGNLSTDEMEQLELLMRKLDIDPDRARFLIEAVSVMNHDEDA